MQYRAVSRIYIGSPSLSAATARSAHIPAAGSQSTSSVCMNNPGLHRRPGILFLGMGWFWPSGMPRRCRKPCVEEFEQPHPVQSKAYSMIFPAVSLTHSSKKIQQPCGTAVYGLGSSEDQKYLISLPSIAERILFAADDAPMRNRSVVSHSLPRISSTMV